MNSLILKALLIIAQIETGGEIDGRNAIGDNGDSVGIYQIQMATIDDVNRHYGTTFTAKHRRHPYLSKRIAFLYLSMWAEHYEKTTGKKATTEIICRIHNGGPQGWRRTSTVGYWLKAEKIIKARTRNY